MSDQANMAKVHAWLTQPLSTEVAQSIDRLRCAADVFHVAVMPDTHLASDVCVGVATATTRLIYPAAVGADIGCGMAAIQFQASAELLSDERAAAKLLAGMRRCVPSLKHAGESAPAALPVELQESSLSDPRLEKLKQRDGRLQFGTLGRGNHFVEFQADEQNQLWLMAHSGSRAMGQAITAHHLARAEGKRSANDLARLDSQSASGQAYLSDVNWAIEYAVRNRLAILAAIERLMVDLFDAHPIVESLIHSHHNHVQQETHGSAMLWVHRKGALSAAAGEMGVIPGSMGAPSYHVMGRGLAESLRSSSHGAGRGFSRGEAGRRISVRQLEREMRGVWFDHRRAHALRDEAPSAYKDIHAVMRAQRELTKIVRQVRPLLSYKGV